jgi:hypothetical protein
MGVSEEASCLCVAEGHLGKQDVGYHTPEGFVKTGETTCLVCNGSGLSPRARLACTHAACIAIEADETFVRWCPRCGAISDNNGDHGADAGTWRHPDPRKAE